VAAAAAGAAGAGVLAGSAAPELHAAAIRATLDPSPTLTARRDMLLKRDVGAPVVSPGPTRSIGALGWSVISISPGKRSKSPNTCLTRGLSPTPNADLQHSLRHASMRRQTVKG